MTKSSAIKKQMQQNIGGRMLVCQYSTTLPITNLPGTALGVSAPVLWPVLSANVSIIWTILEGASLGSRTGALLRVSRLQLVFKTDITKEIVGAQTGVCFSMKPAACVICQCQYNTNCKAHLGDKIVFLQMAELSDNVRIPETHFLGRTDDLYGTHVLQLVFSNWASITWTNLPGETLGGRTGDRSGSTVGGVPAGLSGWTVALWCPCAGWWDSGSEAQGEMAEPARRGRCKDMRRHMNYNIRIRVPLWSHYKEIRTHKIYF